MNFKNIKNHLFNFSLFSLDFS